MVVQGASGTRCIQPPLDLPGDIGSVGHPSPIIIVDPLPYVHSNCRSLQDSIMPLPMGLS